MLVGQYGHRWRDLSQRPIDTSLLPAPNSTRYCQYFSLALQISLTKGSTKKGDFQDDAAGATVHQQNHQHPSQTDFDGHVFANYLFGLYLTISETKQDQAPQSHVMENLAPQHLILVQQHSESQFFGHPVDVFQSLPDIASFLPT